MNIDGHKVCWAWDKWYNQVVQFRIWYKFVLCVDFACNMSGLKKPITLQFGITNSLNNQRLILLSHSDLVSNSDKRIDISPKQTYDQAV